MEPEGLDSPDEVARHRAWHLFRVRELLSAADVFIFTLGMTETWADRVTGTVFRPPPASSPGAPTPLRITWCSSGSPMSVTTSTPSATSYCTSPRGQPFRLLLTVSPVPITATASDAHVLVAAWRRRCVLRAAAAELCARHADIDYLPSFDVIANPFNGGVYYQPDRRTITPEGVERALRLFLDAHRLGAPQRGLDDPRPAPTAPHGPRGAAGRRRHRLRRRAARRVRARPMRIALIGESHPRASKACLEQHGARGGLPRRHRRPRWSLARLAPQ
ncbi:MAG: GSCFA domain-containing protein [bacterium]